jgi:molybdenum cofactor cytidylyltransferase
VIAAVILAAGASTRMGRPKQALAWRGQTLLRRVALEAQAAGCSPIVTVLGARARSWGIEVQGIEGARVVVNRNWGEGIASSIVCGVQAARSAGATAVILMPCDQPFVDAAVLQALIAAHRERGAPMAACEYGGGVGIPALFDRSRFGELARLEGDRGARALLADPKTVARVPFPGGAFDVDTPQDYERLLAGDWEPGYP